jgi:hypothetical protein
MGQSTVSAETFLNRAEAEIAKQYLDEKGIPSQINADDCAGMEQNLDFGKGIRLMVAPDLLARVQQLLQELATENVGMTQQENDEWKRHIASKQVSPLFALIGTCFLGIFFSSIGICIYLFTVPSPSVRTPEVSMIVALLFFYCWG